MPLRRKATRDWNKTSVLFVHGVGEQPEGYSDKLIELLSAVDPDWAESTRWYELNYDQVNVAMADRCRNSWDAIRKLPAAGALESHVLDLIDYILIPDARHWIDTLFQRELAQIVKAGQDSKPKIHQPKHRLFIVAHSLGTLVTYEGLHGIIGLPAALGVAKGLLTRAYFTMGSPLGLLRKNSSRLPAGFALRGGICRPTIQNPMTDAMVSNIASWYDYRHELDPIALVGLESQAAAGTLSQPERRFTAFHAGVNMHDFSNYVEEFAPELVARMKA